MVEKSGKCLQSCSFLGSSDVAIGFSNKIDLKIVGKNPSHHGTLNFILFIFSQELLFFQPHSQGIFPKDRGKSLLSPQSFM